MIRSGTLNERQLEALTARAERLCESVTRATDFSPIPGVRHEGARFGEIVESWLEELHERAEAGDPDLDQFIKAFEMRLVVAERKVTGWWKPPRARLRPVQDPRPRRGAKTNAA